MSKPPKRPPTPSTTCEFLLSLLATTQQPKSHVAVFVRGGPGAFEYVKIIGPTRDPRNARNAHIAVELSTGLIAVTGKLSREPGVTPRPRTGASLGAFRWCIRQANIGAHYGSASALAQHLVDCLKQQGLW